MLHGNEALPVLLLTGYLGSGKTTLVNRILSNRKGIKFAVIVNDLGEVNIDASLIEKGGVVGKKDDSLVALQNGCICCTLKMDLVEQIEEISSTGRFDYIVIEASGICEPAPIAQTICSLPALSDKFGKDGQSVRLDCIVTVVDALRMQSEFSCGDTLPLGKFDEDDLEKLIIEQIEFCNIILLNKASEVNAEELGRIKSIIHALQPKARIIECDFCDIDLSSILDTKMFDFDQVATSAAWIDEIEGEHHHHDDDEEGEAEEYDVSTFVYYRRKPFDINRFDNYVAKKWDKSVIRAKGLCYFSDEIDKCYLFEQAGIQKSIKDAGLWYATMPKDELAEMMLKDPNLARDWDKEYGDRMIKIVFIGQHMDQDAICRDLDKCLAD
ncbi:MAG TPA: cobalamin biosynthesis protein CobW [Rikenellaceae bacterium]|nr:cobalamin biosynthesis protein CobW [Rikenellaceae bacterium]